MPQPFWSIIVPVYNENSRINRLREILNYLKGIKETWELIVVDDCSTDDTQEKLTKMNKGNLFKIVSYPVNHGKGANVVVHQPWLRENLGKGFTLLTWTNDSNSRVKFPQDLINSLSELIRIRYNDKILGLYQ